MSRIDVEIEETIARPIEDVFQRLVDIPGYMDWMPENGLFVSCTKDSDGPVRAGTAYPDRTRLGTVRGEVSEFERPSKVIFHYTARALGVTVMEGWPGYVLERAGDHRTRVCHTARARLYGPFRVLRRWVQRIAIDERTRTLHALKRSLE